MSDQQPVFSIEKIYVRDLSLEVPNAPQVFNLNGGIAAWQQAGLPVEK